MNLPELILAIVVVVMVARVLRDRHRDGAGSALPPVSDDMRMMAEELARLRERVQVLERVITDDHQGHDLAARIDRLRDR